MSSKQKSFCLQRFLKELTSLCKKILKKIVVTVKSKILKSPWTAKGILKSSKTKQMLYDKLLESKICEHEVSYKYIYIYVYICIYIYIYMYLQWLAKLNLSIVHYQNILFSIIRTFLIKNHCKPLLQPIVCQRWIETSIWNTSITKSFNPNLGGVGGNFTLPVGFPLITQKR